MDIYGNNFLISIAFKAKSPSAAANIAQFCGCSKDQIRGVREAAKIKRDKGEDFFTKQFTPFDLVDVPENQKNKSMTLSLSIDRTYENRFINNAEWNELADFIEIELAKKGVKAEVKRKEHTAYIKSTL